jgi:heat-inducible transcriptional repressor
VSLAGRKSQILRAIVNEYVSFGEPVGSEMLVQRYDFGCRSATVRNEMAEMSEHGYLVQPHTSAGRIPTDRGYRYYVDWLMPARSTNAVPTKPLVADPDDVADVEDVVQYTCRLLADVTHYPSVASAPRGELELHRVYLTPATAQRALMVMLFSNGRVVHRLLELEHAPDEAALQRVTNYLNSALAGRDPSEADAKASEPGPGMAASERAFAQRARAVVAHVAAGLREDRVFVEGTSHMMRHQEFHNVMVLERVLTAMEERSVLFEVFSQAVMAPDVTIVIGSEGPVGAMHACSLIGSQYRIGESGSGFIGVFGPTRMHYSRTVEAVGTMARCLSTFLTQTRLD